MKKLATAKKNRPTRKPQHEIVGRVRMLPELTGMSFYAIAQSIGKPQAVFNNIVNRGTLPGSALMQLLCEHLQINANWLLIGEGHWQRPQKRHN